MDLLFLELGILGLVESGGFFSGGLFEVEAFHEVPESGARAAEREKTCELAGGTIWQAPACLGASTIKESLVHLDG